MVVQEYAANIPAAILVRVREELELGARKTLDDCLLLNRKRCLTAGQNAVCECKQTLQGCMTQASTSFLRVLIGLSVHSCVYLLQPYRLYTLRPCAPYSPNRTTAQILFSRASVASASADNRHLLQASWTPSCARWHGRALRCPNILPCKARAREMSRLIS